MALGKTTAPQEAAAPQKTRAPRNRTIVLSPAEAAVYETRLLTPTGALSEPEIRNKTLKGDAFAIIDLLPPSFVDLLFLDPPYNVTRDFGGQIFRQRTIDEYTGWLGDLLGRLLRVLKRDATVYICSDWATSSAVHFAAQKHLVVRNRITWEREKGRGAKQNWKNCSEDIWFCTRGRDYVFNVDAVKMRRRVMAPYRTLDGAPKDWHEADADCGGDGSIGSGGAYRLTHPSNLWTDITVPFWSMPENTDHPTQKPEKLLAKLMLASTKPGAMVLDPFLGSGTTSVVAKKLGRRFVGIEQSTLYCLLAEKRLDAAERDRSIQGYEGGVFWERNSLGDRKRRTATGGGGALGAKDSTESKVLSLLGQTEEGEE